MVEDIIAETIRCDGVVHIVVLIGVPVVCQLFWTEHKDGFVSVLVVFDYCQSCKRLAKAYAVSEDTAV